MTSCTKHLLDAARERRLTDDERAALDPAEAEQADPLALVEMLGGGEQHLSAREREQLFRAAMGGSAEARSRKRSWWLPAFAAAAAASVVAVIALRPAAPEERLKGFSPQLELRLAAQRPGASEARVLGPAPVLEPGEVLRIVVSSTAPTYFGLYEEEAGARRQLWGSGDAPVPAGKSVLGPNPGAGLSLTAGETRLILIGRGTPLPSDPFAPDACSDCLFERLEAHQR